MDGEIPWNLGKIAALSLRSPFLSGGDHKLATLKDVARLAQVSVSTVSHVINGRPDIPERTAARVRKAMEILDYRPNRLARALMKGRSERIGLLVYGRRWFVNPLHGLVLGGIADAIAKTDYCIDLFVQPDVDISLTAEWRARRLDGIIVLPMPLSEETISAIDRIEFPVVVIDGWWESENVRFITSDNVVGGEIAAEHLIDQGHTRLGYVGATVGEFANAERLKGFQQVVRRRGLSPDDVWVAQRDWSYEWAYEVASQWFAKPDHPTGIFAPSDTLALGVHAAATDRGLTVGRDVAIIGYDDTPVATQVRPAISSIRQDGYEIGQASVDMLFKMIEGEEVSSRKHPVQLVVRESSESRRRGSPVL